MTGLRPSKAEREVLAFCHSLGLTDAEIRPGTKHRKLFIAGRFVHAMSQGTKADSGDKGLRFIKSHIRRIAQGRSE